MALPHETKKKGGGVVGVVGGGAGGLAISWTLQPLATGPVQAQGRGEGDGVNPSPKGKKGVGRKRVGPKPLTP